MPHPLAPLDRRGVWAAAVLMVCTLTIGLWVSASVFEHTPHVEDELAYLFQAKTMAAGHVTAPSPPVNSLLFWTPFTNDDGHHWYGKYTPGYPAVLALGELVGAPWLVNPLAAALAVGLTVLLGARLYGQRTGLLAGALLAMSPMALVHSGTFFSHEVSLCWMLGALLAAERVWRTGSRRAGLVVGACLGMLVLTRPFTAVAVMVPLAVAAAVQLWRRRCRRALVAAASAILIALGLLLMYNQHTTGSATRFGYQVYWPFDTVGFGPGVGRGPHGHTWASGWLNTRVNVHLLRSWLFGWPGGTDLWPAYLAIAATLAVLALRLRQRRRGHTRAYFDLLLAALTVSLVVAHIAYWTAGNVHGPRYYFEALAPLALLTARCARHIAVAITRLGARLGARTALARWSVAGVFVGLSVIGLCTTTVDRFNDARHYYGVDPSGLHSLQREDLHDALVFVSAEEWTDFEPYAAANSPFLDTDVVYAVDTGESNQLLIDAMPDRSAYLWADGVLTPVTTQP